MNQKKKNHGTKGQTSFLLLHFLQGALIGLGAVLPGISGGVLSVVFGVYQPVMELLSHPRSAMKRYYRMLIPLILGGGFGFVVVARILGFLLTRYPDPSVCLFVGLIGGMLPSLFREAGKKGRKKSDLLMTVVCFGMILILLTLLQIIQVTIAPSFGWYLFCGFCIALSVIAPGMSFSTLLMPLGLYTPLAYIEGKNKKLKKQYVRTGQTLYSTYIEGKEGVSETDWIAFPYGKAVKEGAPVTDLEGSGFADQLY